MEHRHFLLVANALQSHINPVLHLAKVLTGFGARVTFSTSVSAHRKMFPDAPDTLPLDDPSDPLLTYHPFSDGCDDGIDGPDDSIDDRMSRASRVGSETLRALATAPGRPPVTCVVYALLLSWVPAVARQIGAPSVLYWIQSATAFAVYYHYFHGSRQVIEAESDDPSFALELPGLPQLRTGDVPSFLVPKLESPYREFMVRTIEELYQSMDEEATEKGKKPRLLVNSFDLLEREAISSMEDVVELVPIGPVLPEVCLGKPNRKDQGAFGGRDLIKDTDGKSYMEWLDRWPEKSVVYVSFGSLLVLEKKQEEELARALTEIGRPFLWVVRGERKGADEAEAAENGLVVGWCKQVEVLCHGSVGCFVTHCGWNSTLESLVCGVPTVGTPKWTDQPTNAKLAEVWGVGVRATVDEEGAVKGDELRRCVELVMGETEEGAEIRRRAAMWKEKAREAMCDGGSSERNLKASINGTGFGI